VATFKTSGPRTVPSRACAAVWAFAVAAVCCAFPSLADAHAYVVSATPAAQSTVSTAPAAVTIGFDEQIDLPDSPAIEVFDSAGKRVDKNDAAIDPDDVTKVVVHLNPIPPGSYTVRWRVVSADTHVVHGEFTFGYGAAAQAAALTEESPFDPSAPLASLLRWLVLLGIVAAVGAFVFQLAFRRALDETFERIAVRHTRYGAVTALTAGAALFLVQSIAAAGEVGRGTSAAGLMSTLHSNFGMTWAWRNVALIALAVCATARSRSTILLGALAAAATVATLSLAGHATAARPAYGVPMTMELADSVHAASISAWLGGVAVLVAGLARRPGDDHELRAWLARFSYLAVPAVILTLATGVYASLAHEPHPTLLLTTQWGVSLALKLALFVVILAFGALSLRAGLGGELRMSRNVLRVEAVLAVVILAVTAFLVGQSPPMCMYMPRGARMPPNMKMPPGMQMCLLPHSITQRGDEDVD
jgi:copper transport protein